MVTRRNTRTSTGEKGDLPEQIYPLTLQRNDSLLAHTADGNIILGELEYHWVGGNVG